MWLKEHTQWADGTETIRLVPDEGQGAVDCPQDAILAVWHEKTDILMCNPEAALAVKAEAKKYARVHGQEYNPPDGACWGWGEDEE